MIKITDGIKILFEGTPKDADEFFKKLAQEEKEQDNKRWKFIQKIIYYFFIFMLLFSVLICLWT